MQKDWSDLAEYAAHGKHIVCCISNWCTTEPWALSNNTNACSSACTSEPGFRVFALLFGWAKDAAQQHASSLARIIIFRLFTIQWYTKHTAYRDLCMLNANWARATRDGSPRDYGQCKCLPHIDLHTSRTHYIRLSSRHEWLVNIKPHVAKIIERCARKARGHLCEYSNKF